MIGVHSSKDLPRGFEMPQVRLRTGRLLTVVREAFQGAWQWVLTTQVTIRTRSGRRRLRVTESISLGEKRSVHLIEVDGQRLLLGSSAAGVTLLSQLPQPKEAWQHAVKDLVFADVMESCESTKPAKRKTATRHATRETT